MTSPMPRDAVVDRASPADVAARILRAVAEERAACAEAVKHPSNTYSPKASQRVVCMRAVYAIEARGDAEQLWLPGEQPLAST